MLTLSSKRPKIIALDASEIKIYGKGEWEVKTHRASKRLGWLKIHLGVDVRLGEIVVRRTTEKLRVTGNTVRNWISTLINLYYCFELKPWSTNVTRSLLKEPKYYLWDWSWCESEGAKFENFVASHLLKSVHYWTDQGIGEYALHFLRDKEKREVDFLVTKNHEPWMIEAKLGKNNAFSAGFHHFYAQLKPKHAFQIVFDLPYVDVDCFKANRPLIVPAKTLLSQLF